MDEQNLAGFKQRLQEQLPVLSERYQVRSLAIFGSYVRQEQRPDSDLDLLVTFDETPSLLRFISLENYLTDLLGVKVDLGDARGAEASDRAEYHARDGNNPIG